SRARSLACLLIAALAAVALLLEAVNWIFDTEHIDTFRALLAVSFAVLFLAGLTLTDRAGTVLVAAAGVTVLAGSYATSFILIFSFESTGGLGWGWELVTLVEGLALLAYASARLEPGPGYLALFALAIFTATAAVVVGGEGGAYFDGAEEVRPDRDEPTLLGWPLALAIGTVAATLWGLREARRRA
ncbi:MAG TPA: hypothetical protein VFQ12_10150, partial [Thermoleophilaceae bacterium]|nr:hypothetical protein [Thermoleophilaceae bacterium]